MILKIENTSKIVVVNGVPARVWEGENESGINIHVFITRIAVDKANDVDQFEKELLICREPSSGIPVFPSSIII